MPKVTLKVKQVIEIEKTLDITDDELEDLQEMQKQELSDFISNQYFFDRSAVKDVQSEDGEFEVV